jgi:hypothetical protein
LATAVATAAATAAGRGKKTQQKMLLGGGANIRIGQEILCLLYAGFFNMHFLKTVSF